MLRRAAKITNGFQSVYPLTKRMLLPTATAACKSSSLSLKPTTHASMSLAQRITQPSFIAQQGAFAAVPGLFDMNSWTTLNVPYVWPFYAACIFAAISLGNRFAVVQYENKIFSSNMGGREQEGPASTWLSSTSLLFPLLMGALTDQVLSTWSYPFWLMGVGFIGMWLATPLGRYGFDYDLEKAKSPLDYVLPTLTGIGWILRAPLRIGWSQFLLGFRLSVNVMRILNSYLLLSVGLETIITLVELVVFNFALWGPADWFFWYFCYLIVAYGKGALLILHIRLMVTLSLAWLHPGRYMSDIPLLVSENKFEAPEAHH